MFTAVAHKNLADAESYFDEHLAQNDYYAAGEIRPGQWIGAGAERLGLKNVVTREQFQALCENQYPETSERLTQRQQKEDKRRVFYDFTCSAPKSVSVLAMTLDDDRLVTAHEEATRIAFRELETFAGTRVRKQGSQKDRTTGNLVAAAFTHTSSRALDPQLHTHFTVFNATFDESERCWKALQAGGMYDAIRYGTAVYRNELAKRVRGIGYRTVPAKHGFEIEGVSPDVLKRFSKRSQQRDVVVKELEQKLGHKLSNNAIALAVHQSRAKKVKGISTTEVRERQLAQLQPDELQTLQKLSTSVQRTRQPHTAGQENQTLDYAVAHVFERKSVVPEHELLNVAVSQRLGEVDLPALKASVKCSADLVKTERGFSTRQILATELDLIQTVNAGLQVLDVCAEQGVRLTFFLFPTDDTESMTNAGRLFFYAGDRVDYVIVHNPAKARGDLFKASQLEKQLMEFGAKSVTLPAVTPTTLLAIEKAEAIAKRGLSFAELSHVEAGHLERLLAGEIQWTMQKMFRQYDAIADLLLPTEFVPKEKPAATKEKTKAEPQPQLNFEE